MTMERSASEPTIQDSDYYLPCHGVGLTGHPGRTTHGGMSKDDGTTSSRIAQIQRQAAKYPGPGKYMAHDDWTVKIPGDNVHSGNKFSNGSRDYKPMHKSPDPRHYERKDIFSLGSNASKDTLSKNPRITYGKIPTGKRRSFLDAAEKQGKSVPAPGQYHSVDKICRNQLDSKLSKMTDWTKEQVKTKSRNPPKPSEPAPGHYPTDVGWKAMEERIPNYSVPKEKATNFLDKAVKETMLPSSDPKKKIPRPGPGHFLPSEHFKLEKTSRGSYLMQLRGLAKSPASGYF